jgi:hypothetical protein
MRSERGPSLQALARLAGAGALAILLSACDNSSLNADESTFHLRSINLVEDSPTLQFKLDDTTVASLVYGSATGFSAGHPGRHDVTFEVVLPPDLDDDDDDDETTTPVSGSASYTFLGATDYTVIAYGRLGDIRTFLIEGFDQRDDVDDEKLILQFTHAAPDLPAMDVYITSVQADIATRQYVDTLNFTEASTPLELTLNRDDDDLDDDATLVAEVVIELMASGTGQALYRSNKMTFTENSRVLFAIANANGPGPAAVKLVLAGSGSGEQRHHLDGAALKFIHASSDTPALDVTVGSGLADPLATNVAFRQSTSYVGIRAGEIGMIAVPAGVGSPYVFFEEFSATAGQYYSAYALGPAAVVDAVVFAADARSIPTQTKFRFLHGAASLEERDPLDLYLRLPGAVVDFDDDDTVANVTSLTYQTATSYYTLKEGAYDVYFANAGSSSIVMGPTPFHVANGEITTLMLVDAEDGSLELLPVADAAQ